MLLVNKASGEIVRRLPKLRGYCVDKARAYSIQRSQRQQSKNKLNRMRITCFETYTS